MTRVRRIVLAVVGAVALVAAGTSSATASPPAAGGGDGSGAARLAVSAPTGDAPGTRGGTVPGRTGAAARVGNGAAIAAFRGARADLRRAVGRAGGRRGVAPADQLHNWWGFFPPSSSGVLTQHSVFSSPGVGGGDFVYAPTMKPPSGSCIEVVTADSSGGPELWAWDWCNGVTVGKSVAIDSSFVGTYTTTVDGLPTYSLDEVRTSTSPNTWTAYLYNYTTGAWDTFYTSSGSDQSGLDFGWDMFEVYTSTNASTGNGYFCGDLAGKQFNSTGIQLYLNGAWVGANSSNAPLSGPVPSGSQFRCPGLSFNLVHADDHWHASL